MKTSLLFVFLFSISSVFSQEDVNQLDANGNKHGVWKKFYEGTKQLRYEGRFAHGKEVGTFKFYCEKCTEHPSVIKEFYLESDTVKVRYYTFKGALVSEGDMKGKDRIGEWLYYHEKSNKIMTREFYSNGFLEGTKTTYYTNGKEAEVTQYKQGKKQGISKTFGDTGVLLKQFTYNNDILDGPVSYFNPDGTLLLEGNYVNDRKKGSWKTYKNGKVIKEETFPKPYRNKQ